jgi:hypothetical protein
VNECKTLGSDLSSLLSLPYTHARSDLRCVSQIRERLSKLQPKDELESGERAELLRRRAR